MVTGAALASVRSLLAHWPKPTQAARPLAPTTTFRQNLGRAILLGLEFLIAGDIIRTVVVAPTLDNVLILGLIVIIRTFLSVALQLEIEGRWPWQGRVETPRLPLDPGRQ